MGAFGMHCDPEDRTRYLHSGRADDRSLFALSPDELKRIDAWIERHGDPKLSRAEAVHRLLACALIEHPGQ